LVFDTVIPRNVRISEASSHGKPIILYDIKSTGAISYIELAREFLAREKESLINKKEEISENRISENV
jgi:chromosome partitioning protein